MNLTSWHSPGGSYYHVCKNCPKAPPAELIPTGPRSDRVCKGTGGKSMCGECLDLIGKKECKKADRVSLASAV